MIAEDTKGGSTPSQTVAERSKKPWLRLILSLLLSLLGIWFVVRDVNLVELRAAFAGARLEYVVLGLTIMTTTMVSKAWRWRLMFAGAGHERPPLRQLFWALSLGQLVNTAVPFLRLGEVARVVELGARTNESRAKALGTLVVEKTLDLIMLVLMLGLLLPFLVIPDFMDQSGIAMAIVSGAVLLALITLALKPNLALVFARQAIRPLPKPLAERAYAILVAGLEGLAGLRRATTIFTLLVASAIIAFLAVMTPWVLFPAVDISLGLAPAAAIHVVLTAGTVPPSTPAKVGVFEFLVAFMLRFFGLENSATIVAYTIIYHLVVVIPQIVLGGIAAARRSNRDRV